MNSSSPKKLSVFMINYDWDDLFRTKPQMFRDKLTRDRLLPEHNDFFFFSWSHVSYRHLEGQFKTIHKKTSLYKLKPLLDLKTAFLVSFAAWKLKLKPNAWMAYDFALLPALWLASKLFGGKVVLCVSNQPRVYSRTRRFGAIKSFYSWLGEKLFWRLADHFFTINQTMKAYLEGIGIPANRISVFYVDTISRELNHIAAARKGTVRQKYNLPADSKILLTVGRMEAEKNYEKLLDLFATLPKNYVLIAIGGGSLRPALERQIASLGLADRVILAGLITRDQIWNYFMDADVFVLLSRAEALGLVFWEAMQVNTPVIGSTADGIVETIGSDGERGRIWQESDGSQGFKEKVDFCVTPSPEREAMTARAKKFVDLQRENALTFNELPVFAAE